MTAPKTAGKQEIIIMNLDDEAPATTQSTPTASVSERQGRYPLNVDGHPSGISADARLRRIDPNRIKAEGDTARKPGSGMSRAVGSDVPGRLPEDNVGWGE